ncbi:ribonuclease R [Brevundimonas sp. 2R-24]|uniref:Ribonuclease R n=1 Tax=Peiella sedimenti TaxID=3061083 RepID=A0ABT8SIN8_9CAUL|nr:ribonuclease R [Caulobacteraceae bacterium XZ-24]
MSRRGGGRPPKGLPDRDTLLRFLRDAGEAEKADIARAFGLKGAERRALREMLRELEAEGALGKRGRRGFAETGAFPPVGVADVAERDADGDLFVRLTKGGEDLPLARLAPGDGEARGQVPGLGDRVLVRFEKIGDAYEAKLIKRLGQSAHRVLGVVRKTAREVRVDPVDRRSKERLVLQEPSARDLKDGDLVLAEVGPQTRRYGPHAGRLLEVVGREDQPRAASLIAIHAHGVPTGFSEGAETEAREARPPTLKGREDLRDIPLVTIDPPDARDHDDAVYAEPDEDPKNPGGWVVWVAIADVAAYVRDGSALDREAYVKGNSTYFPDRVEPMLPHALSSDLCSLRQGEERACMAVRMVFDKTGAKTGHRFVRGLMRSAAKLSYQQAQDAVDGRPDDASGMVLERVLQPLWAAYRVMLEGRNRRSPLAIETMERQIRLNDEGEVVSITPRQSLEAHRLIEEMMIQANVCAAETLEKRRTPLIYRVHDEPSQEKTFDLADFLATLGLPWAKGQPATTRRFNELLEKTRGGPHGDIVNEVVLRSQMQAVYSPDNVGHFGLNLQRYAHFTSPIRRYADLVVHRALIRALGLGSDGLSDKQASQLEAVAEHITMTERRSMAAERDATDRYVAAFLEDRVGAEFEGRITGVTRFGLFVRLEETGADGLIPVSQLGEEYFTHDDKAHALVGSRSGLRWRLGRQVTVRLVEATPITGGLLFEMLSEPEAADPNAPRPRLGVRDRDRRGPPKGRGKPPARGGGKPRRR